MFVPVTRWESWRSRSYRTPCNFLRQNKWSLSLSTLLSCLTQLSRVMNNITPGTGNNSCLSLHATKANACIYGGRSNDVCFTCLQCVLYDYTHYQSVRDYSNVKHISVFDPVVPDRGPPSRKLDNALIIIPCCQRLPPTKENYHSYYRLIY